MPDKVKATDNKPKNEALEWLKENYPPTLLRKAQEKLVRELKEEESKPYFTVDSEGWNGEWKAGND